ncbi:hypothetical protein HanXRQr2_Chr09g0408991 [Helianthus annuus]|uniref:Uncharacterized protein n=1 Tax=Helianthus annuus TaxID=4232 RepID=A0A251U290_HELAN|nr:hypothetical protein HanXRQr2_Chr09g0408991 [Helianthus annuus]KAJ0862541.1 hypothetical protein HanPSC8_Chr12g0519411 [Helianthus annuus]
MTWMARTGWAYLTQKKPRQATPHPKKKPRPAKPHNVEPTSATCQPKSPTPRKLHTH